VTDKIDKGRDSTEQTEQLGKVDKDRDSTELAEQ
jgi:hypothetical protein